MMHNRIEKSERSKGFCKSVWVCRVGAVLLTSSLVACSSMELPDMELPDYANPVEWYRSTTDMVGGWFSDEDPKIISAADKPLPNTNNGYPKLGNVPEKPKIESTANERDSVKEQLLADRKNARYSEAAAARQNTLQGATRDPKVIGSRISATGGSSLWPKSPPPKSKGDRQTTSANVGSTETSISGPTVAINPVSISSKQKEIASEQNTQVASTTSGGQMALQPPTASATPALTQLPTAVPTMSVSAIDGTTTSSFSQPLLQLTPPLENPRVSSNFVGSQLRFDRSFAEPVTGANTVNFKHGSSRLSSGDRRLIADLARHALRSNAFLRVVGHASMRTRQMDPVKHTMVNFDISLRRANIVAIALIDAGFPPERLIVDAVGDTQPLFSEAMPSGERGNRRTEIFLETS